MTIIQGNKEFLEIKNSNEQTVYFVSKIDGRWPIGRESSYQYLKCPHCSKIIGTQFRGFERHLKACKKD